ncbi:uncharacterized protein BDR25DRAFT_319117 [Lindgomyces ingoldianus]|uniref:Uncharacterized protein n=1 Tax=Lindgomyces ingoldianus TaxID=673940 RepID=A0ACB6QCF8_9PLEO|nr:uncharacterized protein BDR25DRAFT_319117 [Lindgomyces ingoldianus]KAF2464596.1 hypothetical protein BDR25DRAFT_319117 [Lindgomyces ingoldianus]
MPFRFFSSRKKPKSKGRTLIKEAISSPAVEPAADTSRESLETVSMDIFQPPTRSAPNPPERPSSIPEETRTEALENESLEIHATSTPRIGIIPSPSPPEPREQDLRQEPPFLAVYVGKNTPGSRFITQCCFHIWGFLLRDSKVLSKYLNRCCENKDHVPNIILPDLDPQSFEIYLEWLSKGKITFPRYCGDPRDRWMRRGNRNCSWTEVVPLLNAHILGTTIEDSAFADFIMDNLGKKLLPRRMPSYNTIQHVFTSTDVSEQLKRFVIDRSLEAGLADLRTEQTAIFPPNFLAMAWRKDMEMMFEEDRDSNDGSGCKYHVHGSEAECYRPRYERELKYRMEREAITKNQKKAVEAAERDGVLAEDWAASRFAKVLHMDTNCPDSSAKDAVKGAPVEVIAPFSAQAPMGTNIPTVFNALSSSNAPASSSVPVSSSAPVQCTVPEVPNTLPGGHPPLDSNLVVYPDVPVREDTPVGSNAPGVMSQVNEFRNDVLEGTNDANRVSTTMDSGSVIMDRSLPQSIEEVNANSSGTEQPATLVASAELLSEVERGDVEDVIVEVEREGSMRWPGAFPEDE